MSTPTPSPKPLTSLTAAASRLTAAKMKGSRHGGKAEDWQSDAWEMYNLVGEQRFLANTLANRMSQARFYVGRIPQTDDPTAELEPVEDETISSVLDTIGNGQGGRSQLIARLGINLFICGDGWLAGIPRHLVPGEAEHEERDGYVLTSLDDIDVSDLMWRMLSISEVTTASDGTLTLRLGRGDGETIKTTADGVYLIRVWRPHPQYWWQADSPTRSSLPVLRELVGLTMHVSAQVDSRLAGAGLLAIKESVRRALLRQRGLPEDSEQDPFTDALLEAMITPIGDRSSASAVVPLAVTVPDDVDKPFEYLTFATPLDAEARELRNEAIRRLALGEDAPPELLLGVGGMNHWGAWLVKEDVITTHIEPPLALICDALTTQYLWPVLEAMGYGEEEVRQYAVWYDVSHLIMRPNRSEDAKELNARGLIGDKAVRQATGFDETDAPDAAQDEEARVRSLVYRLVSSDPSLTVNPGIPALLEQVRLLLPLPGASPNPEGTPDESSPPASGAKTGGPPTSSTLPQFSLPPLTPNGEPVPWMSGGERR